MTSLVADTQQSPYALHFSLLRLRSGQALAKEAGGFTSAEAYGSLNPRIRIMQTLQSDLPDRSIPIAFGEAQEAAAHGMDDRARQVQQLMTNQEEHHGT